ncbi:MAG: hypothetical protein U0Q03_18080 [Acidimicrobiales bacterium]
MRRSRELDILPIDPAGASLRGRRILYTSVSLLLVVVLGLAVLDGLDLVDAYGVDIATAEATGPGGIHLAVDHPSVTRPALADPIRIHVDGLHDGELVRLGIERRYLSIFDHNAVFPAPTDESWSDPWVVWEFEADGTSLEVEIDSRLEPAVQQGRTGHVAVLDAQLEPIVEVELHTRVAP